MTVIGVLRIVVEIPESRSLKDKRSVVRSLRDRVQSRFRVSVGEVGSLNDIQVGELAVAVVSTDARHADQVMARIADFAVANSGDGSVEHFETEVLHLD